MPHDAMNDSTSRAGEQRRESPAHGISRWEWLAAAVGLLLLTGSLWVLLARAFGSSPQPPNITFEVRKVTPVSGGWLVQFDARNSGDETAADLRLRASLTRNGEEVEAVESGLNFLPARSTRAGGLYLEQDPRDGRLEIRSMSYQEP